MNQPNYNGVCNPEDLFDRICSGEIDVFDYLLFKWEIQANHCDLYAEKHPLGFIKIELTPIIKNQSISVHLWLTKDITPIHSHHFDLKSKVILGALEDTQFEVKESHLGEYILFDVLYDPIKKYRKFNPHQKKYKLIPNKPLKIENTQYFIKSGVMHQSSSTEDFSVSVMLRSNIKNQNSTVGIHSSQQRIIDGYEKELQADQVVSLIKGLRGDNKCL